MECNFYCAEGACRTCPILDCPDYEPPPPKKYHKPRAKSKQALTHEEATAAGKCPIVFSGGVAMAPGHVVAVGDEAIRLGEVLGFHTNGEPIFAIEGRGF